MKTDEVPQDVAQAYAGNRKLLYAVDERGDYAGVKSAGWDVENYVTLAAVDAINRWRDEAWARAKHGETSPLEYHMYRRRMEPATLSAATGVWRWRLARHMRPKTFAKLSDGLLQRYADVLGISVEELRQLPDEPGG
jgi:hypothetical protein